MLRYCTEQGIGFIPWFAGRVRRARGAGQRRSPRSPERLGATAPQVALAWLLQRSSVMLPIPGTSGVAHLEENIRAATLALDLDTVEKLDAAA